jgi:ATP-binding cassette subfamily C (CFTR/MRP) protein 1
MTDPAREKEQEYAPADPAGAVENTDHEEPLDGDGYEKDYIEITTHGEPSSHTGSDAGPNENEKRPAVERTKSYATNTSAVTRTDSHVDAPVEKQPWYRRINPLRWGGIPPLPETRKVSREYNAPFLSLVYFQWVAPLMSASLPHQRACIGLIVCRLVISDSLNATTSGL